MGDPNSIPDHITETAAKALTPAADNSDWDAISGEEQQMYLITARGVLAAVWPLTETHWRNTIADQIWREVDPPDRLAKTHAIIDACAVVARGKGDQ